jgi:anti-anti-sigma regulatory factor
MPNDKGLRSRIDPGTVWLGGEVDVSTRDELVSVLDVATPKDGEVMIDLSAVAFIGVDGARQIVRFARRVAPQRVTVKGAPPSFRAILEASGWEGDIHLASSGG